MKLDQAMPNPWQILAKVQTFTRMLQIFKVYVYFPKSLRPYRTKNRTKKKITIIIHLDRLSSPIFFAPTSKSIHPSTHFKMKESSKATTWRGRHHLNLPHHQVGLPSKATTWRGRHHLNLPHHQVGSPIHDNQVEQYGGTPALWSAARCLVRG